MKIAYTVVISDLFHYGHLQLLMAAASISDKLICGVLTDDVVAQSGSPPISDFHERTSVIKSIKYVDDVIQQCCQDPFKNLCQLKEEYPNDEIIFVYGEQWGDAPSGSSLNQINITLKQQVFYKKLRHEHIAYKFVEKYYPNLGALDTFTERFIVKDFEYFSKIKPQFSVTTKANTLQKLKPLLQKSIIEKTYVFTVSDWNTYSEEVLLDIKEKFQQAKIVIRSSCLNEDTMLESKAGLYQSRLNIDSQNIQECSNAISEVIESYSTEGDQLSDQILVQQYTNDVFISGVLFTKELGTNAPYYIINYDKGSQTDTVTSGQNAFLLKIFKHTHRRILEQHWQNLLDSVDEIENIIPELSLDIEFAIKNSGEVVIFQVRPLAANHECRSLNVVEIEKTINFHTKNYYKQVLAQQDILKGEPLVLSDMAFWNPAELIGSQPSPLAYDIFNLLFMKKSWRIGLQSLSYANVPASPLMYQYGNKPYIHVNLAFLSLFPNLIQEKHQKLLYKAYIKKIISQPYLHDKVEFEVLATAYDFNLYNRMKALLDNQMNEAELNMLVDNYADFTQSLIQRSVHTFSSIQDKLDALDQRRLDILDQNRAGTLGLISAIETLLITCEELGAVPFVTSARMAFIAEALLQSLVTVNILNQESYQKIKNSFQTVGFDVTYASVKVARGDKTVAEFMAEYGHLRAGTYDITQKRYDQMSMILTDGDVVQEKVGLTATEKDRINCYLQESVLKISFDDFYTFTKKAIELRESTKLIFTRSISDCLEMIAELAGENHLTRTQVSFLKFNEVLSLPNFEKVQIDTLIKKRQSAHSFNKLVALPSLIHSQSDFSVIRGLPCKPNFVSAQKISGEVLILKEDTPPETLRNRIILIESADPGFHWILAYGIKGLVTQYGGAASHMAICCAEMNIPAAIGCGDKYLDLMKCSHIQIDSLNEVIQGIGK